MIDDNEFDFVSQNAHMCAGALAMLAPYLWWPHRGLFFAIPLLLLFTAVKEFCYDVKYEDIEVSGGVKGDLEDFMYYWIGAIIGLLWIYFA